MSTVNPVNPAPLKDGVFIGNQQSVVNATSWRNWFSQLITNFNALAQYINLATNVTQVTATPPVVSSGGPAPVISMPAATDGQNGYLTSTDHQSLSAAVPNTRQVNGKALSSNITLGLASADFSNQGSVNTVLHGNASGNPAFTAVVEADITLAANTTNDLSITKHGLAPQAPNDVTKFLRGDATWGKVSVYENFETSAFNVSSGSDGTATVTFSNTYSSNPKIVLGWNNAATVQYSENFEGYTVGTDMTTQGWVWHQYGADTSTYKVVTGKYGNCAIASGTWCGGYTLTAGSSWTNYSVEFDVPALASGRVIFGFRLGGSAGYWIQNLPGSTTSYLYKGNLDFIDGQSLLDTQTSPGTCTHVKITCNGTSIKVYYNGSGTPTHNITDATYSTGTIGMSGYSTGWEIDNISVTNVAGTNLALLYISALSTTQATVGLHNYDGALSATGKIDGVVTP